ncbi:SDR family oxidoreductase [Sciscionella sediminilitoris]|uniref:SDR family oxidoreductase n=1 Tax=Sciscionella sediminilitoris TaxID=1445613 RepID=UPI0004DF3273|nr:SDR family oxidoreductase [Sciscionella sp. SE31]
MATVSVDFSGSHVFVSGGTSGINLGIAEGFAAAGATLTVSSRSPERVDAAVQRLRGHGGEVFGLPADVRDYEATAGVLEQAHAQHGPIDVLVCGAAGNFPALATQMSANAFKSVVDIDLQGTYHVLRAAHPLLRTPGASVLAVSAPQAFLPMLAQSHVCAAKAGVEMLVRTLALEWGGAGIRVNAVVPGAIEDTGGMDRLAPTEQAQELVRGSVPMGRLGAGADIANGCLLLASPLAAYVTGTVLPVDGGWSLGGAQSALHELVTRAASGA